MPGPCLLLNSRAEACADPESRDTNYESRALPPPLDDFAANLDGAIPRYSGFLPPENGFLPPDYDDLPNHNGSISHYSPEFFGFPKAAVRAPSAAAPLALRASDAAVKVQ